MGAITPSQSLWTHDVVLVGKKHAKLRCCIDFRKLNEKAVKDSSNIP